MVSSDYGTNEVKYRVELSENEKLGMTSFNA